MDAQSAPVYHCCPMVLVPSHRKRWFLGMNIRSKVVRGHILIALGEPTYVSYQHRGS